ncbi:hypothetical protein Glove_89g52 [Diversispora epigaea]|uniref:Uncharacterized protein n=1 Tax=Diversispora epigaea TaxID=1348612 RepID=A0A397J5R4_9GLOM|nr:hypothetical protein Glove_89g52 [Diversispora epigaea]
MPILVDLHKNSIINHICPLYTILYFTMEQTISIIFTSLVMIFTLPISIILLFLRWILSKLFESKEKIPESLKKFKEGTQESIIRWYKITKTSNIDPEEEDEDDDDYYLNSMLLIVKWNDIGLRYRNIQKNNVINVIQGFNGCQQYPNNLSESIFCINDILAMGKQQIAEDIVTILRRTYFERHLTSLGKVYEIQATEKGIFEIREDHDVF